MYVALTRAKEKLILTGILKKAEEKLKQLGVEISHAAGQQRVAKSENQEFLSFLKRLNANTFLQFILMAYADYPGKYQASLIRQAEIEDAQESHIVSEELSKIELLARLQETDPQWEQKIAERMSYVYPYEEETTMRTKVSVSELKNRAVERILLEEQTEQMIWQGQSFKDNQQPRLKEQADEKKIEEESPISICTENHYIPAFMEGVQEENAGAKRGTAMHRVLECFDFTRGPDTLKEQLEEMEQQNRVEKNLLERIYVPSLRKFLKSALGRRLTAAACAGKLYKEKPFVMGKPAKEVLEESSSQEMMLIQGIIDVFFEEADGIVLLDYKTDRVSSGQELADRYRAQMELYQEAIERALGKPVKEKLLYSFRLGETVAV